MAVDKVKLQEEISISRFCRIILGWDYFRLLKESDKRHSKKGFNAAYLDLKEVKNSYIDVDDHLSTFEPLLFEEVKAQIIQKKDEEEGKLFCTQHLFDEQQISQNDLLLLSKEEVKEGATIPETYAFALVDHRQSNRLRLRMYLAGEVMNVKADAFGSSTRLLNMWSLVTSPTKVVDKRLFCLKICSLSTIAREYINLRSIESLPFKDLILMAAEKNFRSDDQAWLISGPLHDYMHENPNESHEEAIQAGLLRKPFVLIQGPPGTGKTQTILALLSAILHATPSTVHIKGGLREVKRGPEPPLQEKCKHWERASPWLTGSNPRDDIMPEDGDDGFFPTTGNDMKPEVVDSGRKYGVKVLVCAPSNSALDEIVLRLLQNGVRDENVHIYNPKIVRIGLKAHHSVKSVAMDDLVKQKLGDSSSNKQKHGSAGGDSEGIRAAVLDEADIVFSTLSFSGSVLFSKLGRGFDVVIIDEAAQAVEPATLVPLANGCKQVFLVGDPVQLPATVISSVSEKYGYGTSLFKRLQRAGYPVNMLKMQYRMHPEIRHFPSKEFYDEALTDGPDLESRTKHDWHDYRCFGPFWFFDIYEGKESQPSGSGSWVNTDEVDFVLHMYRKLVTLYPELKSSSELAIISPYRHQVKLFRDRFKDAFVVESDQLVDINTVDGFQGREKDLAIFSCVRANKDRGIGFVSDFRRMNVGITRAKSSVLVVGSASALRNDGQWNNLIESAEKRNVLFKVSKPYASFFSDENMKAMEVAEG
ncbi:helicase MAGATAMA 3-like isoform X1 [Tripterygium wilfordii]|uniref:Helicase MAGATAMA 3-like isoform X1 n=1 Tax=Tripterygium wilfordii TaxID=458696 RepID=A0A7J7DFB2_TRIWF|nr:helicase MAGATAMA 3-like isoform X1 [Tripterygium wilfordii]